MTGHDKPMSNLDITPVVIYEYPLNEKIRTFLRLESLFKQIAYHLRNESHWGSQAALRALLDIQELLGRNDIKNEILKELDHQIESMERLQDNPDVDAEQLNHLLDKLRFLHDGLYADKQPIGHELRNNEFLNSLRQRMTLPGGTCDFDMPGYHFWLNQPSRHRARQILTWLEPYDLLNQSLHQLLKHVRESSMPREELAEDGFFQKALSSGKPFQMLRISLSSDTALYPEISGNRQRISIRFMHQETADTRPVQTGDDVRFMMTCCVF